MAHPNEELSRQAAAAFQHGDLDALRDKYLAADTRWHVSGRSPLAGDYDGVDQVIGLFVKIFELTNGTYRIEVHDVLANDEHVVSLITGRAELAGKQLNENQTLVSHVVGGKISEVWIHWADQYAVDEFFSS
jgi:ketosteroid isomerase-like protein